MTLTFALRYLGLFTKVRASQPGRTSRCVGWLFRLVISHSSQCQCPNCFTYSCLGSQPSLWSSQVRDADVVLVVVSFDLRLCPGDAAGPSGEATPVSRRADRRRVPDGPDGLHLVLPRTKDRRGVDEEEETRGRPATQRSVIIGRGSAACASSREAD